MKCGGIHPNLILETAIVDARLATHGSINSSEKGGGDIDKRDATLEGGGGKSTQVGDHATTQVYKQ